MEPAHLRSELDDIMGIDPLEKLVFRERDATKGNVVPLHILLSGVNALINEAEAAGEAEVTYGEMIFISRPPALKARSKARRSSNSADGDDAKQLDWMVAVNSKLLKATPRVYRDGVWVLWQEGDLASMSQEERDFCIKGKEAIITAVLGTYNVSYTEVNEYYTT